MRYLLLSLLRLLFLSRSSNYVAIFITDTTYESVDILNDYIIYDILKFRYHDYVWNKSKIGRDSKISAANAYIIRRDRKGSI